MHKALLEQALSESLAFLEGLPDRPVGPRASLDELRRGLDVALTDDGVDAEEVLRELVREADPGLVATAGPRFFGYVIGGAHPVSVAADWLAAAWDQNAGLYAAAPAASVVEEVAGRWLLELFGLPSSTSYGFVTGAQMANFTALAVARHHVLAQRDWDVEARGLTGAPAITVIAGQERHATIDRALRFLGLGTELVLAEADDQGRMRADALARLLEDTGGPTIVCAQAGNVNTGAFDPLEEICELARDAGAWVHVDGAFGLWAAASPELAPLVAGLDKADSWATDGHKWLNVPYDSGIVFCAHPQSHEAAMGMQASYLAQDRARREPFSWTPEASRRARGFAVYATLRHLGRSGVAALIERCCEHARLFAEILEKEPGVEVLNDVVLNQVLVGFAADGGASDERTDAVMAAVQADGTCWLAGSTWQGKKVMRISVSGWSTTPEDVERSADAILRAARGA